MLDKGMLGWNLETPRWRGRIGFQPVMENGLPACLANGKADKPTRIVPAIPHSSDPQKSVVSQYFANVSNPASPTGPVVPWSICPAPFPRRHGDIRRVRSPENRSPAPTGYTHAAPKETLTNQDFLPILLPDTIRI